MIDEIDGSILDILQYNARTSQAELAKAVGLAPSAVVGSLGAQAGQWESAVVRVHATGKVTVYSGSSGHGQGHKTTFAQIASAELGIPYEDIDVMDLPLTSPLWQPVQVFGPSPARVSV